MNNRNTPHELDEMFPDAKEVIHELKIASAHFAGLATRYHEVNRAVHRMETNVEPVADETMETQRRVRLKLLDEIAAMIAGSKAKKTA